MSERPLLERFVAHVANISQRDEPARNALESLLRDRLRAATQAWPRLSVPEDDFLRFFAERLPASSSLEDALRSARVEDLYLACACSRGDDAAIEAFHTTYGADVDRAIFKVRKQASATMDVKQLVLQRLFVSQDGKPPKIAEYGGRGDLRSWARAVALRTALNTVRGKRHEVPLEDALAGALAAPGEDPELGYLKVHYRNEFRVAFESAVRVLGDRARSMLLYYYVDGLGVDELARIYRVHASNVSRGLAKAREELLSTTRATLVARLRISSAEVESVMRLIGSRLEASLGALLRDPAGKGDPRDA